MFVLHSEQTRDSSFQIFCHWKFENRSKFTRRSLSIVGFVNHFRCSNLQSTSWTMFITCGCLTTFTLIHPLINDFKLWSICHCVHLFLLAFLYFKWKSFVRHLNHKNMLPVKMRFSWVDSEKRAIPKSVVVTKIML